MFKIVKGRTGETPSVGIPHKIRFFHENPLQFKGKEGII